MKKGLTILPFLLILILTGCTQQPSTKTTTPITAEFETEMESAKSPEVFEPIIIDEEEEAIEEKEFGVNSVLYTDKVNGYGLTLPYTWEEYKVHKTKDDWGNGLMAKSFHFGFESWDDIFSISIIKKEDYEQVINVPSSVQLGINDKYIFLGSQAQAILDKNLEDRWGEVGIILDSFNLK